jgi:glycosyltransferase involved in cell wall biosynthesis
MKILLETSNSFSNAFRGINSYALNNGINRIYLNNRLGNFLNKYPMSKLNIYDYTISMMPNLYTGIGRKNILWIHDALYFEEEMVFGDDKGRFKEFRKILEERSRSAEFIATPTVYSQKKLVDYLRIEKNRVKVFPMQIMPIDYLQTKYDETYLKLISTKYNLDNKFNVLCIGSPHYRKNLTSVVRIFNKLSKSISNAQLIIVSYPRKDIPTTLTLYAEATVNNGITIVSHIDQSEINALYYLSSVLLNLSLEEGFGLPNVEAQFCGLPVITSNLSCMPEVLGDGAIFVDPYLDDEVLSELLSLKDNADYRDNIINAGRNNVLKYTNISNYSELFDLCV